MIPTIMDMAVTMTGMVDGTHLTIIARITMVHTGMDIVTDIIMDITILPTTHIIGLTEIMPATATEPPVQLIHQLLPGQEEQPGRVIVILQPTAGVLTVHLLYQLPAGQGQMQLLEVQTVQQQAGT